MLIPVLAAPSAAKAPFLQRSLHRRRFLLYCALPRQDVRQCCSCLRRHAYSYSGRVDSRSGIDADDGLGTESTPRMRRRAGPHSRRTCWSAIHQDHGDGVFLIDERADDRQQPAISTLIKWNVRGAMGHSGGTWLTLQCAKARSVMDCVRRDSCWRESAMC